MIKTINLQFASGGVLSFPAHPKFDFREGEFYENNQIKQTKDRIFRVKNVVWAELSNGSSRVTYYLNECSYGDLF